MPMTGLHQIWPGRLPGLAALLLVLHAVALPAQAGSTTDVLTGVVKGDDGKPIAEALVSATSLETQISRTVRTDQRGRYVLLFPDGGGQYTLLVRAIGRAPRQLTVTRQADEDRLVTDVILGTVATRLADIAVQARRAPLGPTDAPGPGATEKVLNPDQVQRLPIDAADLMLLASLTPGVVMLDATDSTAAGFSVAGQRPQGNATTLDGLLFGGSSLPPEALRNVRVITNTYDVSRGQFSGGLVASTTRGGTNVAQGGFSYGLRDRDLEVSGEENTGSFGQGFTQHQVSLGLGGPVVRNRLFVFGSGLTRLRRDPFTALTTASPATLGRLGVAPDSVTRFLSLVTAAGVPGGVVSSAPDRASDDYSLLGRVDWIVSQDHTLMFRGDWRHSSQDPMRSSPLGTPATAASSASRGGGVMASLTSRFGTRFTNEGRVYGARSSRDADAALLLPQGRVQVAGELSDGRQSVTSLTFGGVAGAPQASSDRSLELSDEFSWFPGSGGHRFKLGGLLTRGESEQELSGNRYGTFTFASLADFEANRPSSFTRTVASTRTRSTAANDALYLSDTWRLGELQLTYGLRAEFGRLGGAPAYNPRVDELFGRRTDRFPRETQLSPRAGFTWTPRAAGPAGPRWILRGGLGLFRSPLPSQLGGIARGTSGLASSEGQLVCLGPFAPAPDWVAYGTDPATIPTACAAPPPAPGLPQRAPTVSTFAPGFRAAQSARASFGVMHRLSTLASLSLDLTWARGRHLSGATDLNLVAAPRFTLADEAGRPVYVPAATILPGSGTTSLLASRKEPEFGQVLSLDDDFASTTWQATVAANGITSRGTIYQLSYTLQRVRDQSSGGTGLGSATTAGNPNLRDWAVSDFDRRHAFLATVTHPFNQGLEITAIGRLTSGAPYTPRVGGDVNGDGARNDRAFLFDPAIAADTALANGMTRLLAAGGGARSCLERQLGAIAGRNSCRGPWQPALDLQVNWRPNGLGLRRRLAVSILTVNLLGGVDQLLHGSANVHGWGQAVRPDATLLYVRGFDPGAQRFLYTVNERFGATNGAANAYRVPFQLGVQVRYTIGPDRMRDAIRGLIAARGAGRGAAGATLGGFAGGGGAAILGPVAGLVVNPSRALLLLGDSLRLSAAQRDALTRDADSLDVRLQAAAAEFRKDLQGAGANPDMGAMMAKVQPRVEEIRKEIEGSLARARQLLTVEQWAKVPERITSIPERLRAFGGGRQQRRPRP